MSCNHEHQSCCKHESVKYCQFCKKVYCKDCGKEWREHYFDYPYTPPVYPNHTAPAVVNGVVNSVTCFHESTEAV